MNEVDYLKLAEMYSNFLVASGGVSITVLTLVLTLGSKSIAVDLRSFLIAALLVATTSCFIGAQMMAETAASFSHLDKKAAKATACNPLPGEQPPKVIADDSISPRGRAPEGIALSEHLFLLASTNIFTTAVLLLFAMMLLPVASEKVEPVSIRRISVSVFLFVVGCALIWMFLAVEYRMNVKGGFRTSIFLSIIGGLAGFLVSYYSTSGKVLLWLTFIPIGFFPAALLLRFALVFSDSNKARSPYAYVMDIGFFIIPISFSYISLSVAAVRLMFGKVLHNGGTEENKGGDLPDEPQCEQKESSERRGTAASKRIYIVASLSACIFIASTTILLGRVSGAFHLLSDVPDWLAVFSAIVSAIGVIYPIIFELEKRKERRAAQENKDKTDQSE
ncbi:MAG TPA: hypothetical protein VIQ24_01490 [Pyrinomonadaceae bacterium]